MIDRVANILAVVFAIAVAGASIAFAYVLLAPLDVLTDWKLTTDKASYRLGETVTVDITYTKHYDVSGSANFYLECPNPNGGNVRYGTDLITGEANADRPKGSDVIEVVLVLPPETQRTLLPAKCRIAVSANYMVYSFRPSVENNVSNDFEVVP